MKECKCCGKESQDNAVYCTSCGATSFQPVGTKGAQAAANVTPNTYGTQEMNQNNYAANQNYGANQNYAANQSVSQSGGYNYQAAPVKSVTPNYPLGIIGAVLGFLAAMLIWYFCTQINLFIYIQGALLVILPYGLYKLFGKCGGIKSVVIISAIAILLVYPIDTFSNIMSVKSEYNKEMEENLEYYFDGDEELMEDYKINYEEAEEMYEIAMEKDSSFKAEVTKFLIFGYISTVVGVVSIISSVIKGGR
ncbi:MAG: zinc ribbon domain-containing protein [Lachnospiraceae bacterium]|nr:zinc ribbon domain-containing protein [Lachnospiraceae bacterium]